MIASEDKSNRQFVVISFVGLIVGAVMVGPTWRAVNRIWLSSEEIKSSVVAPENRSINLQELASPHLQSAASQSHAIIDEQLAPINQFFKSTKEGTAKFAELSLGWGSKWRLVADGVPYTKGNRHSEYLRSKFEEYVFTPDQFEKVIRQSVDGYLDELRSIEGKMLVAIRADINDFPVDSSLKHLDSKQWQTAFDDAIARASAATTDQLESDVGTQLVSIITGEILTQVAVRLGISSGILTVGAASGWTTFGVGLVIGVIIDQIVTVAWDHWSDPKGKLIKQLNMKLEELNILIRNGDSQVQGLRSRFREIADQRALLRKEAIMEILNSYSAGAK